MDEDECECSDRYKCDDCFEQWQDAKFDEGWDDYDSMPKVQ